MPSAPIAERATKRHDMYAYVASDTIEAIIARIEPMVRSGRRMTLMRRYLGDTDTAPDLRTGLVVDPNVRDGGVMVRRQDNPKGASLSVVLTHASGFGVSAYDSDGTEEEVAARYEGEGHQRRNCERIEVHGGLWGVGKEDRIVLNRFSDYGVGEQVVLAFDTVESCDVAEVDAANLDVMAATGRTFTPADLTSISVALRYHWRSLAELLADPKTFQE